MSGFYLSSPLEWRVITQPFGVNWADWYAQWGLKGHNGVDFRADINTPCYAVFKGVIVKSELDNGGGETIIIRSTKQGNGVSYEAIYYHLNSRDFKYSDYVEDGEKIGLTGNTGKFTTGAHLHLGLRKIKINKSKTEIIDSNNGFNGCINPMPYMKDGKTELLPVDIRYYREKSWLAEFKMRFKNNWLHKYFIHKLNRDPLSITDRELIALVYGGWGVEEVFEPSMYPLWATLKKSDWKAGVNPPIRLYK